MSFLPSILQMVYVDEVYRVSDFIFSIIVSSSSFLNSHSMMSTWLWIIFSIGLSLISGGFPGRFLKYAFHFWNLLDWQLLVLISRYFSFRLFHLLFALLIGIVYLANFWFYWFALECIPIVLVGMFFFNSVGNFLSFFLVVFVGFSYNCCWLQGNTAFGSLFSWYSLR